MAHQTNHEIVTRYGAALAAHDMTALAALRHPDWTVYWPQSGELVHSTRAFAEIIENYPGGAPTIEITRTVGAEDQWVVTAGNTPMRVAGSGDFWWSEWRIEYPNGEAYVVVDLIELRDGLVHRETTYWAAPFDAPAWRAPWVDRAS
jgi:hypothetical protein